MTGGSRRERNRWLVLWGNNSGERANRLLSGNDWKCKLCSVLCCGEEKTSWKIRQTSAHKRTSEDGPPPAEPVQSQRWEPEHRVGSFSAQLFQRVRRGRRLWGVTLSLISTHMRTCSTLQVSRKPPAESNPKQSPSELRPPSIAAEGGGGSMKYFSHQNEEERWMSRSS